MPISPLPVVASEPLFDGLTSADARERLVRCGSNQTAETEPAYWRRLLAKFWAPVPCMLEAAIVLQLAIGERVEAAVVAALLVFNAALGLAQEHRAKATLDALRARLALNASVKRDGLWRIVPVADLVPGDLVKLTLGSIVPADVELVSGDVLLDVSTLTGESLPVEAGPGYATFAGALVRRGEATAVVTQTGARTRFGRTAELVRTAHAVSSQQKAVLRVVQNLTIFNGAIVLLQVVYALAIGLPLIETIPLVLTAVLAAIPVALPATFTLATAIGARSLALRGVLPTRLSAVDEAATMDVLCVDKTGTLTLNALSVACTKPMAGVDEPRLMQLAALASSVGGNDPVDAAIRAKADAPGGTRTLSLIGFTPFDPDRKIAEATVRTPAGETMRIVKGAFAKVGAMAKAEPQAAALALDLEHQGFRVLAVASGAIGTAMSLDGLIALSDTPRPDAAKLIAELRDLGVETIMITGDAAATARVVAKAVGLDGPIAAGAVPDQLRPEDAAVYAGVFPEDKFKIVKALQAAGHVVGMCGDGANDAPALRQAQMGIAVLTATDVAKSAAGIVLTEPGLQGVVAATREGRVTFQRILTYTLRSVTRKIDQLLFLTVGLVMTGHAILSPMLMVLLMAVGDVLAMAATTDHVRPSRKPNAWRIDSLTFAGLVLGFCNLAFCSSILALGTFGLRLDQARLQTLAAVVLVFSGQAVLYAVRERKRFWSSRPSSWMVGASMVDGLIIAVFATQGILMAPLSPGLVALVLVASLLFTLLLDQAKLAVFARLKMT